MYSITNNYFSVGSLMKKLGIGALRKIHDHMNKIYKKKNDLEYSYYSEGGGSTPVMDLSGCNDRDSAMKVYVDHIKKLRKSVPKSEYREARNRAYDEFNQKFPKSPKKSFKENVVLAKDIVTSIPKYMAGKVATKTADKAKDVVDKVGDTAINISKKTGIDKLPIKNLNRNLKIAAGVAGGAVVLGSTAKLLNAIANLKRARNK